MQITKNYTLDFTKARVSYAKNRGSPDYYPEIIFEDAILVSKKDSEYKSDEVDRLKSIIYPEGCENLNSPETIIVSMDYRHNKFDGAGYVFDIQASQDNDYLNGKIKVGPQHVLIDKNGKVYGSAYASAWATIGEKEASKPENVKLGKTYLDFIPENVKLQYFKNGEVIPIFNSISVELDWNTEPELINGVYHIKKYSIVRVSWLINTVAGQQQSRINPQNYTIKNKYRMSEEQLKKRSTELDTVNGEKAPILNETVWDTAMQKMLDAVETVFSDDLAKVREANLGKEATDLKYLYERMCSCMNKSKPEDEITKKRSEDEMMAMIQSLTEKMEALTMNVNTLIENKSPTDPTGDRDGETNTTTTDNTDVPPVPPVAEAPVTPIPEPVADTRMGKQRSFDVNNY